MIAQIRYHSEKYRHSENFAIIAKILLGLRKFRYAIGKFTVLLHPAATVPSALAASLHPAISYIFFSSFFLVSDL